MLETTLPKSITLHNPFDAHMHWRIKETLLRTVAKYSTGQFAGGLLMPNIGTPKICTNILNFENLSAYRAQVLHHLGELKADFLPIFTYYLSPELPEKDLLWAWEKGLIAGVKYYPKGGTTNSDKGLSGFRDALPILEVMEKHKIPFLVHGETPMVDGKVVGDFKRESVFYEAEAVDLVRTFPGLPIVFEHITMAETGHFVLSFDNVHATITPQALCWDDRALFNGMAIDQDARRMYYTLDQNGMVPSRMCRPIVKDEVEVAGLRKVLELQAIKGLKKFGLGTDTAPHDHASKYREGCACGVFSAPVALEMYAMAFEEMGILDHLSVFACDVMPEFYGIKDKLSKKTVILEPTAQLVPKDYDGIVTPYAGLEIPWTARVEA